MAWTAFGIALRTTDRHCPELPNPRQSPWLQAQRRQAGVAFGARLAFRPVKTAIALGDGDIVDAGLAAHHQPVLVERPLLVAVCAIPLPGRVLPFILESHGDVVVVESPGELQMAPNLDESGQLGLISDDLG